MNQPPPRKPSRALSRKTHLGKSDSGGKFDPGLAYAGAVIFCFCFWCFYLAPVRTPWDSWFSIHTAYSFLHGNWGALTDFVSFFPTHHSIIIARDGQPFSIYPIGPSLFAIPIIVIADLSMAGLSKLLIKMPMSMELEALTAAWWCSCATVMMMYLSTRVTANGLIGILAAFIFAFCSPIFSTATRALWQHGPLVVCILATMLTLHAAKRRPAVIPLAGLFVAMAFICRPLSGPFVGLVAGYVAIYHRERFIQFIGVGAAIAIVWIFYNYEVWGALLPPYYNPSSHTNDFTDWGGRFFGPLFSPGRGLFVFCPVFVFSLVGVALKVRARTLDRFDALYIAAVLCHLVVIALSPVWWAGHSFGPRFMSDIVPMLVYLMLPAMAYIANNFRRVSGSVMGSLMASAIVISLFINAHGAFDPAVSDWNTHPVNVDSAEGHWRLWNWRDLQFLRGTGLERSQK